MHNLINTRIYACSPIIKKLIRLLQRESAKGESVYRQMYSCLKTGADGDDWNILYSSCTPQMKILPSDTIIIPDVYWPHKEMSRISGENIPTRAAIIRRAIEMASPECKFTVEEGSNLRFSSMVLNKYLTRVDRHTWVHP